MREHDRNDDNLFEHFMRENRVHRTTFEELFNRLPSAPILKHETQVPNEPQEGMFVVDPTNPLLPGWCFYLSGEWYCIYPRLIWKNIKVYGDTRVNKVGDGAFRFHIEEDLDKHILAKVEAGNGTVGTGSTIVQISNQTKSVDLLSTRLTIASGQFIDNKAAVINNTIAAGEPISYMNLDDRIWIDVDAVGAASRGLYVYMAFTPYAL